MFFSPAGTQLESKNPVWLTDGDVVQVGLDNIGTVTNTYRHVNVTGGIGLGE
jgi:hypothetical protein